QCQEPQAASHPDRAGSSIAARAAPNPSFRQPHALQNPLRRCCGGKLARALREKATLPRESVAFFGLSLGSALAAEQRQDALAVGVGDAERLDAELLLDLQSAEACRLLVHVGVDQLTNAAIE